MYANLRTSCVPLQPMFSVTPSLATNATALVNPYLGPMSPGLVPNEIMPSAPVLMTSTPNVPVPAAAAAAAQKLMRTDRLEVSTVSIFLSGKLKQGRSIFVKSFSLSLDTKSEPFQMSTITYRTSCSLRDVYIEISRGPRTDP